MIPQELIIIGGGASIQEGIALGLKERIKDKFVIALNFAYRHFDHTCLCFVDKRFYQGKLLAGDNSQTRDIINYEHLEALKKEDLIIGTNLASEVLLNNTITLKNSSHFERDILTNGCYRTFLCGLFGLTLGSWLMNFEGKIYLLGYDWTKDSQTHYYNDIKHRGINNTATYKHHSADFYFRQYLKLSNYCISNVSINSNIDCFEKITYTTFFTRLDSVVYNQDDLRAEIRTKLTIQNNDTKKC
jgi:hypothetical protein